jgi:hypothetical protein
MLKGLKALLGLAGRMDASSDELAPSLPAAEAELTAAREARDNAEAAYRASLLRGDEAEDKRLDADRHEAGRRIDRATALIEVLRQKLAEAEAREAEVVRIQRYEEAKRKAAEGHQALALYVQAAEDVASILRVVAEAEEAVFQANLDLPHGVERLLGVEASVRNTAARPEILTTEVEVVLWVEVGSVLPGKLVQGDVLETGPGRGIIRRPGAYADDGVQVELRRFMERSVVPGSGDQRPPKLVEELVLPGFLAGEPAFATPIGRPFDGVLQPGDVLGHLSRLQAKRNATAQVQDQPFKRLTPLNMRPVQALRTETAR